MAKWDKGLDYEATYALLLKKIKSARGKIRCYLIIALIQLRNGARISEAVRAFKEWVRTGRAELYVRVSKKKREELRLMVIPDDVDQFRLECVDLVDVDDVKLRDRVRVTLYQCFKDFKMNTHSLRYAFITYLLRQGVNPAIVSKIVKHSRLDTLLTYVQEKVGEEILRGLG